MSGAPLLLLMTGDPMPAYDLNFMCGMPAGLTYTNSSTTRTYFGSDGLLKTAAADEPIFEYNPVTLALLGMRWEMEQRTNLALYSTLPGGGAAPTGWSQTIATGTSAPVASIYGNADGSVAYSQSATAQRPFFAQTIAVSANTTYSLSLLIESRTGTLAVGDIAAFATVPSGATVTYPACSANPSGGGGGALGTGELRVQVAVAGTAGDVVCRIGLGCSGNVTGTAQFSRPQFEAGASRSSFIPTAGSAVTRQPDVLRASSISPWYRQDEGTVVFEGVVTDATSTSRGLFAFSDGTGNERIGGYVGLGASSFFCVDGGATQADLTTMGTVTQNSVFRHAGAYKLNDFAGVLNAGTVRTDTSGTIATVNQLRLGGVTHTGANPFMGYARRFQYYNRRLPDAQIQGMSRV